MTILTNIEKIMKQVASSLKKNITGSDTAVAYAEVIGFKREQRLFTSQKIYEYLFQPILMKHNEGPSLETSISCLSPI